MRWRLVQLAVVAGLLLSACGGSPTATTPAGKTPEAKGGSNAATKTTSSSSKSGQSSKPAPTPVPAVPRAQLLPNGKAPTATRVIAVSLWGHPETTERDLKLAKEAGFTWVKQRFEWRYLEPSKRGKFEWAEADRIVNAVAKAGLGLMVRVDNQPQWARGDGIFPDSGPPSDLEDWKDFLQELAARYKGRIHAYELWNEPNLAREWAGNKPDPRAYVELLKVGYGAIKGEDPDAIVISAGLSPTTDTSAKAMPDVDFLKGMYAAGVKGTFDMLGVHAAGFKAEPEADPAVVAQDPALTNNDPSSPELKRVYAFRHIEDLRKVMEENDDAGKQMAIVEMGWTADPRPGSPYHWHSVTEEQKADYLVRAFKWASEKWSPWMGLMTVIYIPDPTWTPKDEQYYWAITNPDGTPRPAYDALKKSAQTAA